MPTTISNYEEQFTATSSEKDLDGHYFIVSNDRLSMLFQHETMIHLTFSWSI